MSHFDSNYIHVASEQIAEGNLIIKEMLFKDLYVEDFI